jgi:hypothetical protein
MNTHERPIVTEENKVAMRGGVTGNNVRYVLVGSIAWPSSLGSSSSILSGREQQGPTRRFTLRSRILPGLPAMERCDSDCTR